MKSGRIAYTVLASLALVSCWDDIFGPENLETDGGSTREAAIAPSMYIPSDVFCSTPGTKSLIGKNTAVAMNSNFIRVDEIVGSGSNGTYTFNPWSQATIMEGKIASSPDDTQNSLRALTLVPTQTYRINGHKISSDKYVIDNYYHTRMIGWYPQTCELGVNADGKKITTGIDAAKDAEGNSIYSVENDGTYIHFRNLGLDKDLMMTDMREAQQWHAEGSNAASDMFNGTNVYRQPFGYHEGDPTYSNFFSFRHYRSAIRLYAEAEQSDQNLAMWGTILNIRIINQPTACKIRIPETVGAYADYANNDIIWDEDSKDDFPIMTDAMFFGDPGRESLNEEVHYPIELDGATSANRVYLGYALIEPNHPVDIELHTTSGIYSVTLSNTIIDPETKQESSVLNAGVYYNVTMSLQTTGAITEVLESRDDELYYDLSKEQTLEGEYSTTGLRYANSYIVDANSQQVKDALDLYNSKVNAELEDGAQEIHRTRYDGFAFCATVIGNGDAGIISNSFKPNKATISPYSARLIWETSRGLVTDIELIHGYVRFKVKYTSASGFDTEKGNALIGVYDKNNKLIWSWHIWITDTPSEIEVNGNKFLDRNLGATVSIPNSPEQALLSYGLYYQWGRKDPSMYPPTYDYPVRSLLTSSYYDYASDEKIASEVRQYARPGLEDAIAYPQYLILPTMRTGGNYVYNWMYDNYTDLWGEQANKTVVKTIYDPCPYGYRVPGGELQSAVSSIRGSANRNGYGWSANAGEKTFFLPYTGFKGDDKGSNSAVCSWMDVGRRGDYQTARITRADGQMFHRERIFISRDQSWDYDIGDTKNYYYNYYDENYTNRRTAAAVRCMKDTNMSGAIVTDIKLSYPDSHNKLIAGDVLTITYSAETMGNSSLTGMSLTLNYRYDNEDRSIVLASFNGGLGSRAEKTYNYTVENKEHLAHILESGYTFTVTATNNLSLRSSSNVQANRRVYRLTSISPDDAKVYQSKTLQLTAMSDSGPIDHSVVSFTSSNTDVATVSGDGLVTGKNIGSTTITASVATTDEYTGVGSATRTVEVLEWTGEHYIRFPDTWSTSTDQNIYIGVPVTIYADAYSTEDSDSYDVVPFVDGGRLTNMEKTTTKVTYDGKTYTRYKITFNDGLYYSEGEHTLSAQIIKNGNTVLATATKDSYFKNGNPFIVLDDDFYDKKTNTFKAYVYCEGLTFDSYPEEATLIVGNTWHNNGNGLKKTNASKEIAGKTYYAYTKVWAPAPGTYDVYGIVYYPKTGRNSESGHKTLKINRWKLVTNVDELGSGKFLITGRSNNIGVALNNNNVNGTALGNVVDPDDSNDYADQVVEIVRDTDNYQIKNNSNSTYLRIGRNNRDYPVTWGNTNDHTGARWSINIASDGVATVKCNANQDRYLSLSVSSGWFGTSSYSFIRSSNAQNLYFYKDMKVQ